MYKYSRDYKKLFRHISDGHVALGLADYYRSPDEANKLRDPCCIERHCIDGRARYHITVSARGHTYGHVLPGDAISVDEANVFSQMCASINLEWIDPDDASPNTKPAQV